VLVLCLFLFYKCPVLQFLEKPVLPIKPVLVIVMSYIYSHKNKYFCTRLKFTSLWLLLTFHVVFCLQPILDICSCKCKYLELLEPITTISASTFCNFLCLCTAIKDLKKFCFDNCQCSAFKCKRIVQLPYSAGHNFKSSLILGKGK
jgi:hypothetical protein